MLFGFKKFMFLVFNTRIIVLSGVEGSPRMVSLADAHEIPRLRCASLGMTIKMKNALVER